jgi:excisionase family DNA binding protein
VSATDRPPAPRTALSLTEAAASLGLSEEAFDEHVRPELELVRVGRRVLVPLAALEAWLASRAEPPMTQQVRRGGRA